MSIFVKICGITNEEDALLATALDADALGFVFAPSPRQVHAETVRDIVRRLPREVTTVGVFRNESPRHIVEIVNRTGLHGVQLHGGEPESEVEWIRERVSFVIQAFAAGDPALATARGEQGRRHPRRLARARARAKCSTGGWPRAHRSACACCSRAGSRPRTSARRSARCGRGASTFRPASRRSPAARIRDKLREFVEAARRAALAVEDRTIDLTGDDVAGVTRPWDWQVDE